MQLILNILLNIAVFQGIILGLIILNSPLFKNSINKYLAYAILTLSALLLNLVLEISGAYVAVPFLEIFDGIGLELIFPVYIFLFILHQVDHPFKHSKDRYWFFVPFLFTAILNIICYLDTIVHVYTIPLGILSVLELLKLIQIPLTFIFMPWVVVYAYKFIKLSKSDEEKRWLYSLWSLVFILLASWVIIVVAGLFIGYNLTPFMICLSLFATLLIHWTAYSGIYKFKLSEDQEEIRALLGKNKTKVITPLEESSPIESTPEKAEKVITKDNPYFKKLEELCRTDKIFKDSSLDREKVAEKLGISTGYVSQLVNSITGDNFANYINRYRVEAVKQIILNDEFNDYSLVAIGMECGFSSKTTFHNSFKKITGMTPNAYRKEHK